MKAIPEKTTKILDLLIPEGDLDCKVRRSVHLVAGAKAVLLSQIIKPINIPIPPKRIPNPPQ